MLNNFYYYYNFTHFIVSESWVFFGILALFLRFYCHNRNPGNYQLRVTAITGRTKTSVFFGIYRSLILDFFLLIFVHYNIRILLYIQLFYFDYMLRDIDNYFLNKEEPTKSCLLFLREFILAYDSQISKAWKYRMPFYCYKGKMLCYLWTNKDSGQPYIGIVDGRLIEHPDLITEKRSRMKIMVVDPLRDVPVDITGGILKVAITLRENNSK